MHTCSQFGHTEARSLIKTSCVRLLPRCCCCCLSCWSHEHAISFAPLTFPTWQHSFKLSASFPLRDGTKEKKKRKKDDKGQSLNPLTLPTFSPGSACSRFETTCGMFALRLLRLVRDGQCWTIFIISGFLHQSQASPSPPPKTRSPPRKVRKSQYKGTKCAPVFYSGIKTCQLAKVQFRVSKMVLFWQSSLAIKFICSFCLICFMINSHYI